MKTVILCGGQGTRIRDITDNRMPKPMVPIGGRPILWHIMKYYACSGFKDFILCLGHLGWQIKEFFLNYESMTSDFTISLGRSSKVDYLNSHPEEGWKVTMAETGEDTLTGGRLRRILQYIDDDVFFATYGDGVGNIDLRALLDFHLSHGKMGTLTGTHPTGRFGELGIDGSRVVSFQEKPDMEGAYINGGFFVFHKRFIEEFIPPYPDSDNVMLERLPLQQAAERGELMVYRHSGFWHPMDTYRDWEYLNRLCLEGNGPWETWRDR